MKNPKRQPKPIHKNENRIIERIDLAKILGPELEILFDLVKTPGFSSRIKLQNQAALLYRGIHMKVLAYKATAEIRDHKNVEKCLSILEELRNQYSQIYNRIPIDVTTDGRPVVVRLNSQGDRRDDSGPSDEEGEAVSKVSLEIPGGRR